MAVSVADKMSDTVKLNHTPSVPINKGRIYRQGRRKISCLVSERKMDFLTMPRLWKKFVPIIWKPTIGNTNVRILRALDANAISSSSCVNIPTAAFGMKTPMIKHKVVTDVASLAVFQKTSLTLLYFFAP